MAIQHRRGPSRPTPKQLAASRARANREIRRRTLTPDTGAPTAQRLSKVPLPSELSRTWWPGEWACRLIGGHAQDTIPAPRRGLIPWCPRCGKQGYLGSDDRVRKVRAYGEQSDLECIIEWLITAVEVASVAVVLWVVLSIAHHLTHSR